jgi:DnaJ-class molecular chaperone
VSKSATEKEIKSAYRKLARKFHPDVNPGDKTAEDKFKDVSEAYEVLSDADKRKKYDQFGDQWKAYSQGGGPAGGTGFPGGFGGFPGGGGGGGFRVQYGGDGDTGDLSDLFATLFGDAAFGGAAGGPGRRGNVGGRDPFAAFRAQAAPPQRGEDIEAPLAVSLEEAYHGGTRNLTLQGPGGDRRIEVKIPKGVQNGQKIRLAGQGTPGQAGPGDLYLTMQVAPHPSFERKGDDLYVDVPVNYLDAALGGKVSVPTLPGPRLSMSIPSGTQSGQAFRLGGQGMPRLRGDGNGDLYARAKITVPKSLSPRERQLLTEIRESADAGAPLGAAAA